MGAVVAWLAGFLRVFWVCRVSLLNVVVGVLFFWQIVQAQNLMADLSSIGHLGAEFFFWAGVFFFTGLLWAFPVHYGARRSLNLLKRMAPTVAAQHYWLILLLPRLLGLLPFVALALGIRGARESAAGATQVLPLAELTMTQGLWLYAADALAAIAFAIFIWRRTSLIPASWTGARLHPLAAFATAAIFLACYIAPLQAAVLFPRALLVPPLFGSLVLGASWLTREGDRTGFPFLATLALGLGVLTGLNAHFNDLRTLPNSDGDKRLEMTAAIEAWKTANGCGKDQPSQPCPHPIVIAIAGGASRAAFTAATFVGEFLDSVPPPRSANAAGEARTPGRRIFAISGVSGGAYGAAVIQAALLDAQRGGDGMTPPCRSAQTTWFGFDAWRAHGNTFGWRQCLQALTSGDYLSSTIVGLAFRDFAAPPWQWINLPRMEDRAAILEMTWERQYAATMEPGRPFYEGGDRCRGDDDTGLCRRMAHAATYVPGGGNGGGSPPHWMPMLLLNGTSVATGRHIVASDLASTQAVTQATTQGSTKSGGPLFSQAYDLREAMSGECPNGQTFGPVSGTGTCAGAPDPLALQGPDVRLSTAALTSARFPIISPAGVLRMLGTGYGDQVVDGGYFENSGLTTALDIVRALELNGLNEVALVSITNDPAFDVQDVEKCRARYGIAADATVPFDRAKCTGMPRRPATTPLLSPADTSFLGRFVSLFYRPFQTLVAVGDGHSDELMALIDKRPPGGGFYPLEVSVTPSFDAPADAGAMAPDETCDKLQGKHMTMAKVSMSWWLAAAAQADLDIQRCAWKNRVQLRALVGKLDERR